MHYRQGQLVTGTSMFAALGDVNGDGALDAFVVNQNAMDELWINAPYRIVPFAGSHGAMAAPGPVVYTSIWANVTADGTVGVSFAENLAALGTPEWWLASWGWTNNFGYWETNDTDGDFFFAWQERIADTVPTNGESYFHVINLRRTNSMAVVFGSSTQRVYSLDGCWMLVTGSWTAVEGQTNVPGDASGTMTLIDTNDAATKVYRVGVSLP